MGEPLVMPQVEVGLRAVVEHVDLAVLVRAHRPGVDVDIRVELLEPDPQPALLEQHADRRAGQSLAQRADHPAGHENVLGHRVLVHVVFICTAHSKRCSIPCPAAIRDSAHSNFGPRAIQ